MAGFRNFQLTFTVSSEDTEGSTVENGKIYNSNGTFGYTNDKYGVKACLEDFCRPLINLEDNGEGWQIDTELCPNSEAILLKPNVSVYAMFFKHITGMRLMLGLNYWGMISCSDSSIQKVTDSSKYSIGFIGERCSGKTQNASSKSTSTHSLCGGGIFLSIIPAANNEEEQEKFNPSVSIQDESFYTPHMTPVLYLKQIRYSFYSISPLGYPPGGISFIHRGTNDTYNQIIRDNSESDKYGCTLGSVIKLNLLISNDIIGVIYLYKGNVSGRYFCGNILEKCRNYSDNSISKHIGLLSKGNSSAETPTSYGYTANAYLWNTTTYKDYLSRCRCADESGVNYVGMTPTYSNNGFIIDSPSYEYLYAGYVIGDDPGNKISVTSQQKALLRADLFRFVSNSSNKYFGQLYNNNEWMYIDSFIYYNTSNTYANSPGVMIRWNNIYNTGGVT